MDKKINYKSIISVLNFILVILFSLYIFIRKRNYENFLLLAILVGFLLIISAIATISQLKSKKSTGSLIISIATILFSILTFYIIRTTPTIATSVNQLPNFVGKNINDVITWANKNKIEYTTYYEYSDQIEENQIFAQSVESGTKLSDIENLYFIISKGFNYDKKVIVSSYVGQQIDDVLENIKDLHLSNLSISFETNNFTGKDIILSQNLTGEIRRNDELKLVVSLGNKNDLTEIEMTDLTKMDLFDAVLFLERNGIKYKLASEFSDKEKETIIKQSIEPGTMVTPLKDEITLTISKGKKIKVPDLLNMNINDITNWIIDNNLKIQIDDTYDNKIAIGKVVKANYKKDDIVEEGTTIKITTSKGPLKMPSFKSLSEFRTWANNYNINYEEEYEFNSNVSKGSIIEFSLDTGDMIDLNIPITVTISNGKAITVPNFVGKNKTEISNLCKEHNLSCTFTYGSYSTTTKDVAIAQNKKADSKVVSGTSISITLSKGSAKTFTIEISESQLTLGDANKTISTLKKYFESNYPDVTFTFATQASNTYSRAGFVHENSQVKDGTKVTQGKTYKVIITK